jgi:hypothetical protein
MTNTQKCTENERVKSILKPFLFCPLVFIPLACVLLSDAVICDILVLLNPQSLYIVIGLLCLTGYMASKRSRLVLGKVK